MILLKDIKRVKDPIYFDRMIAKGNLKLFLFFILFLPFVIWGVGTICQLIMSQFWGTLEPLSFAKDGLFWDTYENYINPNSHTNISFSRRLYILVVGIIGVFLLNGILVSSIVSWVEKRSERWKSGEIHYDKKRWFQKTFALDNFVIVIGGNQMVPDLIRQLFSKDHSLYTLIMTNRDVASLRKKIASVLGPDEERVVIYHGERTLIDDLSHLQIERAKEIYVIGEQLDIDQSGSHHDVKNMECVKLMSQLLKDVKDFSTPNNTLFSRRLCRVMFEYQSSFSVFQFTDVDSTISDVMDFKPFNYYETWAQNVLVCPTLNPDRNIDKYLPLEGTTPITPDSPDTVHLIIVGMSRMGIALGVEAAHIAHYPNFIKNDKCRTKITFIDSAAKKEMRYFQGHYKELFALSRWRYIEAGEDNIFYNESGYIPYDDTWHDPIKDSNSHSPYRDTEDYTLGKKVIDVDWEFIQGDLEMPSVLCYIRDAALKEKERLSIAICFSKDNASFAASLYLPDQVYDESNNVVQVLAYQPYGDAMCQSFKNRIEMKGSTQEKHRNNFNQFAKLKAFGMMNRCYDIDNQDKMEHAAAQLWEQYNITYRGRIGGRNDYREKLGKGVSVKAGKSLASSQWSNNYAAAHLWTKLRNIGWDGKSEMSENTLIVLAQLEHIRWNMEQLLLGYAPLNPDEQKSIIKKKEEADDVEIPNEELLQLSGLEKEKLDSKRFPILSQWLDAWKDFDEKKEIFKANMSHVDICSFDVLAKIDKEATKYDEDLTKILPQIYNEINKIMEGDD